MIRFAREGRPFMWGALTLTLALCGVAFSTGGWTLWAAAAAVVLSAFVFYFFRDPERRPPSDPGLVLAPGDGRVVDVAEVDGPDLFGGRCRRISIFLSVFDVHVQRAPVSGEVVHRDYRPGGYAVAWKPKASEENEQASLGIRTGEGPVLVRQIAGLVARRIVTYPDEGDRLERGERIGIIRFGSRVDTFLPLEWPVACAVGEKARAGTTALARMPATAREGAGEGAGERPEGRGP